MTSVREVVKTLTTKFKVDRSRKFVYNSSKFITSKCGTEFDFVNCAYQKFKKWDLTPECLALVEIKLDTLEVIISHVFISIPGKGHNVSIIDTCAKVKEYNGARYFRSIREVYTWYEGYSYLTRENDNTYYLGFIKYVPKNTYQTVKYMVKYILQTGIGVENNVDPYPNIRKFIKPPTFSELLERNLVTDGEVEIMKDDNAHWWINKHRLELVHLEGSIETQKNNFLNWCCMNKEQRAKSDEYSLEIFHKSNIEHYYYIITRMTAIFAHAPIPEYARSTSDSREICDIDTGNGISVWIYSEDPGLTDRFRENNDFPAMAHIYTKNNGNLIEVGQVNISGDCPKTPNDIVEYFDYGPILPNKYKILFYDWAANRGGWEKLQIGWEMIHRH